VKHHLNDCNYVLQKLARSRPFVVHVDRMHKCNLDEQSDSKAENSDIQLLSDLRGESPRSHNQMSKMDINANAVSESTTAYQPVKSNTAAIRRLTRLCQHPPMEVQRQLLSPPRPRRKIASIILTRLPPTRLAPYCRTNRQLLVTQVTFKLTRRIVQPMVRVRSTTTSMLTLQIGHAHLRRIGRRELAVCRIGC